MAGMGVSKVREGQGRPHRAVSFLSLMQQSWAPVMLMRAGQGPSLSVVACFTADFPELSAS